MGSVAWLVFAALAGCLVGWNIGFRHGTLRSAVIVLAGAKREPEYCEWALEIVDEIAAARLEDEAP